MANGSANVSARNASNGDARSNDSARDSNPKEAAKDVLREASGKASNVKEKVVQESKHTRHELKQQASGFFKELRAAVADQVGRLANVLRTSEREIEEQNLDELAEYPRQMAEGVDDVTAYLRKRSGSGMRRDFERAVSEQPVAVLGGLAAVGALTAWYLRRDRAPQGADGHRDRSERSERSDRRDRGPSSTRAGGERKEARGGGT